MEARKLDANSETPAYTEEHFAREDETDDRQFYARDRFVNHMDTVALATVERIVGTLVREEGPAILDLMAGWDSHLPHGRVPGEVIGLGLNRNELSRNPVLTDFVIHDVNRDPRLPFPDGRFDAVLNTVSVDYMTRPKELFREVGRVLKPGGLFLVIFSNRMFPQKAVKIWRQSGEQERVMLVDDFFRSAGCFEKTERFVSKGKPRPRDDKYAGRGIPSDPVYAVYAERQGGDPDRPKRPALEPETGGRVLSARELNDRKPLVRKTLCCPHCGERMKKWEVPVSPFTQWDAEFMYIWCSYRQMYDPDRDCLMPIPVHGLRMMRDGIVPEE
jgi:SAM-dependent methyltransferase